MQFQFSFYKQKVASDGLILAGKLILAIAKIVVYKQLFCTNQIDLIGFSRKPMRSRLMLLQDLTLKVLLFLNLYTNIFAAQLG